MRDIPRSAGTGAIARLLSIFFVAGCVGQIGESTGRDLPDGGGGGAAGTGIPLSGLGGDGTGATGKGPGTGGSDPGTGGASGGTIGTGSGGTGGDGGGAGSDAAGAGGSSAGGGSGGNAGRGGMGGRGGSAGSSGFAGRGGSTGTGGRGGTTGTGGASSTDGGTGSDGGTAATFTDIYTNVLVPHCSGSQCHNPGSQHGIAFSSQTNAYNSVKPLVTAGNGANSSFYRTVNGGSMPPGGPKLSSTDLAKIKAWIDAGALNN